MLTHYLSLAVKVLLRRKFFTFISLFGISFTLVVLMVVTAMLDHMLGPDATEPRQDRSLYVDRAAMYGPHSTWSSRRATSCSTVRRATCPASSGCRCMRAAAPCSRISTDGRSRRR